MRLIKKYANRRLYDTETSAYINLEDLAGLVRGGVEIQVVGVSDGADLTKEVLLQVVLEQLQGADLLSVSMLHRMIRSSGDDPWQKLLRKQLGAGMELLSAQMDQMERIFGLGAESPKPGPGAQADQPAPNPAPEVTPTPAAPTPSPAAQEDVEMAALRERLAQLEDRLKG